jgi:hypothetical protein
MARELSDIEAEIRALPRAAQEHLLSILLEQLDHSIDPDIDGALLEEVQRRSRAFDAGLTTSIPMDEALASIRARLRR